MLSWTFLDFFQYYHKAHKNIAYSIENSLRQPAAKFFPQKGANLKSKKAHCAEEDIQNRFSEYKTYKYKDPLTVVKIKSTKMLWLWDIV